jgi:hypothetical protein
MREVPDAESVIPTDHRDTATRRPPTGFDQGARKLVTEALVAAGAFNPRTAVDDFFADRFSAMDDYFKAVGEVFGQDASLDIRTATSAAVANAVAANPNTRQQFKDWVAAEALVMHMPEADFRVVVHLAIVRASQKRPTATRISRICATRGIPWTYDLADGLYGRVTLRSNESSSPQPTRLSAIRGLRGACGSNSSLHAPNCGMGQR